MSKIISEKMMNKSSTVYYIIGFIESCTFPISPSINKSWIK